MGGASRSCWGSLHVVAGGRREVARERDPDPVFRRAQVASSNDEGHQALTSIGIDLGREHDTCDRTHDAVFAVGLEGGPEARRAHLALGDLVAVHLERVAVQGVPHVIGQRNLGRHQAIDHESFSCCGFSASLAQTYDAKDIR